jgi:hypothetical protein
MLNSTAPKWVEPSLSGDPDSLSGSRILNFGQIEGLVVLGQNCPTLAQDGHRLEDLRGRPHRLRVNERSIPVIVTFEPQHLLRVPLIKPVRGAIVQLAKLLKTQGGGVPIKETESNWA